MALTYYGLVWEDLFPPPLTSKISFTPSPTTSYHSLRREKYRYCALTPTPGFRFRLPRTKIVWSQIIPCSYWRIVFSSFAAEKSRTRINSSLAKFVIHTLHRAYISYPPLHSYSQYLYHDGVHLYPHVNDTFLETLRQGIFFIHHGQGNHYPTY